MLFYFKQVRISPEIDWYHYQSANAAPTAIMQHRMKTDPFLRSVTSEPTVGGRGGLNRIKVHYIVCGYSPLGTRMEVDKESFNLL